MNSSSNTPVGVGKDSIDASGLGPKKMIIKGARKSGTVSLPKFFEFIQLPKNETKWNAYPMTDEGQETGLIGGFEKREIKIAAYDSKWPEVFQTHAIFIKKALGGTAMRIEHIGSTSVPGLQAKPIVDMLLVVEDSAIETDYRTKLEHAGYQLRVREPDFHEHRMFRTPEKHVQLHVFSSTCREIERYLTFRNRLRTNLAEQQLYEQTKQKLAKLSWADMNDYADAKSQVIERIIGAARAAGEVCG